MNVRREEDGRKLYLYNVNMSHRRNVRSEVTMSLLLTMRLSSVNSTATPASTLPTVNETSILTVEQLRSSLCCVVCMVNWGCLDFRTANPSIRRCGYTAGFPCPRPKTGMRALRNCDYIVPTISPTSSRLVVTFTPMRLSPLLQYLISSRAVS